MSNTLTLDFTDSSFDDGLNKDGITEFVLSNEGGGLGVFAADGPFGPGDSYVADENINATAGLSAMAITTNPGTEFTFEFLDEDDSGDRTDKDAYVSAAMQDGNEVFTLSINEKHFADGIDITNGDSIRVDITEKGYTTTGTPAKTTVTPIDVTTAAVFPNIGTKVGELGHNGTSWVFDEFGALANTGTVGDWSAVTQAMQNAGGAWIDGMELSHWAGEQAALLDKISVTDPGTAGETVPDLEYSYLLGDAGGNGGETTWVISGDLSGRDGTAGDDSLGFRAGHYDGVFLGGDDFDTLVFSHSLDGDGQLLIDLSSGIGMFGNNQASSVVQFAEIENGTYDLDWERLETEGSSNDFVIVGGGIGSSDDNTGLTSSTSAIVDGFFEMSLGMGEDQVYVDDTSTGITLDLSGANDSYVEVYNDGEDSSEADVYTNAGEDSGYIEMEGRGDGGVVDYIYAGDNNDLHVFNDGEDGVVVDFGLNVAGGYGEDHNGVTYYGEDTFESYSDNDAIDLRGMDSVEILGEASKP